MPVANWASETGLRWLVDRDSLQCGDESKLRLRPYMIGDWSPLAEAIQLAIAPVFLLTGVAGMLNALGVRLARVIDRARALEAKLAQLDGADARTKLEDEIESLATRGRIINWSTALMVICALLIGLTVIELFYSAGITGRLQLSSWVSITFLSGLVCFILACVLYLAEILVASRSVRIGVSR